MTFSITEAGAELLDKARESARGLATSRLTSENTRLVRVLIALRAGAALPDHPNPGEAVLTVHSGRVELSSEDLGTQVELRAGQTADVPQAIHRLDAVEDTVAVLTLIHL